MPSVQCSPQPSLQPKPLHSRQWFGAKNKRLFQCLPRLEMLAKDVDNWIANLFLQSIPFTSQLNRIECNAQIVSLIFIARESSHAIRREHLFSNLSVRRSALTDRASRPTAPKTEHILIAHLTPVMANRCPLEVGSDFEGNSFRPSFDTMLVKGSRMMSANYAPLGWPFSWQLPELVVLANHCESAPRCPSLPIPVLPIHM